MVLKKKNKREIPPLCLANREEGTSLFLFDGKKTLVSYTPKKRKVVLLLSSMHRDDKVDEESGKPEIILTYNMTKGGTDTFDKLCNSYTVARTTNRWPMRFWCAILDQAGINSLVLLSMADPTWKENPKNNRRQFLRDLAVQLCKNHQERRLTCPTLQLGVKSMICKVLKRDLSSVNPPQSSNASLERSKRKRCFLCKPKDRKTKNHCSKCSSPFCDEHRTTSCEDEIKK